jgi:hypothetical protein
VTWVDYFAMARYDLHLDLEEFWDLTPGMFQALCKRRNAGIRYERYANALTAAAVYNSVRTSEDSPLICAFDFLRDEKESAKLEKLREGKKFIKKVIGQMPMMTPRSKLLEIRRKAIIDLAASGYETPEELFDSVWPSLKPTAEESSS